MQNNIPVASKLLEWYDHNARDLPWRIPPLKSREGVKANPYHIWLSEIMLQQTTVKVVEPYYKLFLEKWPTIKDLASADQDEIMETWAGLGYYRRARNIIQCAQIVVEEHKGIFPKDEKILLKLPGVGSYTAAAIQAIGFNKKANVVDTNISRIIARLFVITKPISLSKKNIAHHANNLLPSRRFGDYAQALMDLGSQICTSKNPQCMSCPINHACKSYHLGLANKIPYIVKKDAKPMRYGYVFVTRTKNNDIILERRPDTGLLGGTLSFPSSKWNNSEYTHFHPPFEANWQILNDDVTHTFSHFKLTLKIAYSTVGDAPPNYLKKSIKTFNQNCLSSLMRKVFDAGKKYFP